MKMVESSPKWYVTINFSFSHSVFNRLVLQTRKNQGLFGKGLTMPDPDIQILIVLLFNPFPDMQILGFSNSASNKDMMSKIWKNGNTII